MIIYRKIQMEDNKRTRTSLSNRQSATIGKFLSQLKEIEEVKVRKQMMNRDENRLEFYTITPKDQLPAFLQKMKFQTLHIKEKQIASNIKIFRRQKDSPQLRITRKKLRDQGNIMLLSEIYQKLQERGPRTSFNPQFKEQPNQIQQWQKKQMEIDVRAKVGNVTGCDYRAEMERGLQIIEVTHASQCNLINRYILIQNSSKILKKQLDQKKFMVQESIKHKMKLLYDARTGYHQVFEERNKLKLQQKILREERKEEKSLPSISLKSMKNINKSQKFKHQNFLDDNQCSLIKIKKNIEELQTSIAAEQDELRRIVMAQNIFYKITLKNGTDVRQSGLIWVVRKLGIKEQQTHLFDFPQYLDKKSISYLVAKANGEEEMQILLEEKKNFVNEIGKSQHHDYRIRPKADKENNCDLIVEDHHKADNHLYPQNIPRKYRKSLKKVEALHEEFIKNCSLFQYQNSRSKGLQISSNLEGLSNKQIYQQVGDRIKRIDLSKIKKERQNSSSNQLVQYQNLLTKIKEAHIRLEDMDIQQENHLVQNFKDNKDLYFLHAAACFGYKKAYSMIIKNFSWDNANEPSLH